MDGKKYGYLKFYKVFDIFDKYSYLKQGILYYDELDGCIESMKYIQNIVVKTKPDTETDLSYKTKDNVRLGAYSHAWGWTAYVDIYNSFETSFSRSRFPAMAIFATVR